MLKVIRKAVHKSCSINLLKKQTVLTGQNWKHPVMTGNTVDDIQWSGFYSNSSTQCLAHLMDMFSALEEQLLGAQTS